MFIMTIGIPAAGKSEYYKKNYQSDENMIYLSSDRLREEILGDVNDQSKNSLIFGEMQKRTIQALKAGKSVYYDATNLSRKKRINFLKQLPSDCPKIAIVFAIPFEICIKRNNTRDRHVPLEVMERMYRRFQPPYYVEGFSKIIVVPHSNPEEVESLQKLLSLNCKCPHDNPHHILSCGDHCIAASNYIENNFTSSSEDVQRILYTAALWHDIGKFKCKSFDNKGVAHYFNHEKISAYDYLCQESIYEADTKELIIIANLIENHMIFYLDDNGKSKIRKLYGEDFWVLLSMLHIADVATH